MAHGFPGTDRHTAGGGELLAYLRPFAAAALRPTNLLTVLVVLLGWAALISWTGNGPGGWQARACAGLDEVSRACAEVRPAKDASRVVPHTAGLASWAR